jgi:dihydropteroate synthase
LNVTPDSFSDGAEHISPQSATDRIAEMIDQGADIVDIGAESTRPGSQPVPGHEQLRRLLPVLKAIQRFTNKTAFSIDTTRAAVVQAAFDCGATIANDVSAGRDDPALLPLVAELGMSVCLMHMLCTPATMQDNPTYDDVTAEVAGFLQNRVTIAADAGIVKHRIIIDPGIGFGKTDAHNLQLLHRLADLSAIGQPILVGTSRKGFIGRVTDESNAKNRQFGTAATVCWAIANGADIVRVHDVRAMRQVVEMTVAIRSAGA